MATTLTEAVRRVLDGRNFATVATINPDGGPQASVVWVLRDGDAVLFSTQTTRQKARNLVRDPRISLTMFDIENPYYSFEIRGTAELIPDPDKTLPVRLSQKYLGQDPPPEPAEDLRFIVSITAEKVTEFSP